MRHINLEESVQYGLERRGVGAEISFDHSRCSLRSLLSETNAPRPNPTCRFSSRLCFLTFGPTPSSTPISIFFLFAIVFRFIHPNPSPYYVRWLLLKSPPRPKSSSKCAQDVQRLVGHSRNAPDASLFFTAIGSARARTGRRTRRTAVAWLGATLRRILHLV